MTRISAWPTERCSSSRTAICCTRSSLTTTSLPIVGCRALVWPPTTFSSTLAVDGLAVLRAQHLSGVAVCGGVEVAQDRVFVSHRLAQAVGLSAQAQFVDADACSPSVLPILKAATHLFAYSAVFSSATRAYLARSVIASGDSNWLVYVTFDKADVLEQAGVQVSRTRHEQHCTEGGAHLLGKTGPLSMSVSGQKLQANIFARCVRSNPTHSATRFAEGVQLLNTLAASSRRRGQLAIEQLMTSTATETRASKRQRMRQRSSSDSAGEGF